MRTFPDVRIRPLLRAAIDARRAMEANDPECLPRLQALAGQAHTLGLTSGWLDWSLAVAQDLYGDPSMALDHIVAALNRDPLSPNTIKFFEIITERVRTALADIEPADPDLPRLYALLQRHEETDMSCHLAMER